MTKREAQRANRDDFAKRRPCLCCWAGKPGTKRTIHVYTEQERRDLKKARRRKAYQTRISTGAGRQAHKAASHRYYWANRKLVNAHTRAVYKTIYGPKLDAAAEDIAARLAATPEPYRQFFCWCLHLDETPFIKRVVGHHEIENWLGLYIAA